MWLGSRWQVAGCTCANPMLHREATGGRPAGWLTFCSHLHPWCMRRRGAVPSAAARAPGGLDTATEATASAAPAHTMRAGPDRQPATRMALGPAYPAGKNARGGQESDVCSQAFVHLRLGAVKTLTMQLGFRADATCAALPSTPNQALDLSGNALTGGLPSDWIAPGAWQSLASLDLSHNPLGGSLPSMLPAGLNETLIQAAVQGWMDRSQAAELLPPPPPLRKLLLSSCRISGSLPWDWALLDGLMLLSLNE